MLNRRWREQEQKGRIIKVNFSKQIVQRKFFKVSFSKKCSKVIFQSKFYKANFSKQILEYFGALNAMNTLNTLNTLNGWNTLNALIIKTGFSICSQDLQTL